MIFDITTFTLIHTLISLVAITAGLVVMGVLMAERRLDGWIGLFLVTTALTSITGFGFPFTQLIASHYVGAISLVILPPVVFARYRKHLRGKWRGVPALLVSAPTQKEPPFVVTQLLVLAMFAILSIAAFRKFPPEAARPTR